MRLRSRARVRVFVVVVVVVVVVVDVVVVFWGGRVSSRPNLPHTASEGFENRAYMYAR